MVIGPNNRSDNRLGRRLRKMRTAEGWTLAHVAETHGIDKGVLSRIERGERVPSLPTLRKLRDIYHVYDETFLTWLDMLDRPEREGNGGAAA